MNNENIPAVSPAAVALDAVDFAWPDGQRVFAGFSLTVAPGEFVAILGPSGCGKTTLLNLLSGFEQPHRGSVRINGVAVRPEMPELGYVFQSPHLFPWLSALENVRFGLRMADQLPQAAQYARARDYLALVGLAGAEARLPHQLSGGMQQRVSLARTLALEPSLLLMDEPFAALDAITRNTMNEETLRLWSRLGQTTLFITHDIDEAVFLADRVVVLGVAPAGIARIAEIDLPRPRSMRTTRSLPQFIACRNALMEQITLAVQAA
ncbi:ABC transporter ATP-binding protein [Massilia violaceinigra]|uniref:ABC transporter ATP-binding protein n=1 Tax=Massilia violaceinigra TaxID=2045208 RepID=A0ABY4A1H5_9BURK|nr:ABC transporter ATP-binding protein [Massilia violaceinigra]UOD28561.1 ABC transporter ATP-binding protein [Massilia violaceinigra]